MAIVLPWKLYKIDKHFLNYNVFGFIYFISIYFPFLCVIPFNLKPDPSLAWNSNITLFFTFLSQRYVKLKRHWLKAEDLI